MGSDDTTTTNSDAELVSLRAQHDKAQAELMRIEKLLDQHGLAPIRKALAAGVAKEARRILRLMPPDSVTFVFGMDAFRQAGVPLREKS